MLASAEEWYDRNLSASVKLMVDSLNTFVSTEGYTGPSVLDDGFILSFQGEKAVIPDGLDVVETTITRALVEDSVSSGSMRTGRLVLSVEPGMRCSSSHNIP